MSKIVTEFMYELQCPITNIANIKEGTEFTATRITVFSPTVKMQRYMSVLDAEVGKAILTTQRDEKDTRTKEEKELDRINKEKEQASKTKKQLEAEEKEAQIGFAKYVVMISDMNVLLNNLKQLLTSKETTRKTIVSDNNGNECYLEAGIFDELSYNDAKNLLQMYLQNFSTAFLQS